MPLRFFIDLLEPVNYGIGEPGFSIRRWCISVPLCQVFESPHHCEATRRAGQAVLGFRVGKKIGLLKYDDVTYSRCSF